MTKKKPEVATPNTLESTAAEITTDVMTAPLNEAVENSLLKTAVGALIASGVLIDYSNPKAPVFRIGHRDHVLNAWRSNPAQAWRDYEYELTVMLAADATALG